MAQLNDTMVQGDLRVTGTAYGTLSGNASTATAWQTSRDFVIKDSTAAHSGTSVSVNGGAAVTLKLPSIITAKLDGNASSATIWQTPRDFVIKDSTAAHSGTSASVDGGAGVTLKLPATITASLDGNASTASIAYALANSDGSGASAKAVAGNLNGFAVTSGTSGTNGFLSSNLGPGVLTISNRVSSSKTNTTTITSNTASFGGNLSVPGTISCGGGLGVKTGFTMLNNSNTPVATIANNGDIATSGTVTATGNMSASGALTVTGAITGSSSILTKGSIYTTNAAGTVATTVLDPAGTITASGNITSATGGVYANSGSIEGKYGEFANYLMACDRYADGTATANANTTITWPKGDTDLLLVQNGTSEVTIDMVNLLQGKVYWLHSGRARKVELTASLSGWTIYIYDKVYSSLTSGAKIPLQDNIKSSTYHGQFSVAIIRTAEKTFYAIMSYGETSKEHEYGYNHYTYSNAYSDKPYTFYRIASFNLPDVGVTECFLTLRLSFILTYISFSYMPTDYTDIEVVMGVRQENTTSYQTWVSRRQTYVKGTSNQIAKARIDVGTYTDNGKTKIYIALVVPAHTSNYSRYLADFAYYASAGVLEYNPAAYTSTTPSGYTVKDHTDIL